MRCRISCSASAGSANVCATSCRVNSAYRRRNRCTVTLTATVGIWKSRRFQHTGRSLYRQRGAGAAGRRVPSCLKPITHSAIGRARSPTCSEPSGDRTLDQARGGLPVPTRSAPRRSVHPRRYRAPFTLKSIRVAMLVVQVIIQNSQEEGAKASAAGIRCGDGPLGQHMLEKSLGEDRAPLQGRSRNGGCACTMDTSRCCTVVPEQRRRLVNRLARPRAQRSSAS